MDKRSISFPPFLPVRNGRNKLIIRNITRDSSSCRVRTILHSYWSIRFLVINVLRCARSLRGQCYTSISTFCLTLLIRERFLMCRFTGNSHSLIEILLPYSSSYPGQRWWPWWSCPQTCRHQWVETESRSWYDPLHTFQLNFKKIKTYGIGWYDLQGFLFL